jgi:hypothetical protein
MEMYYAKVQTIHLEATPVLTIDNQSVDVVHLLGFYRRF